MCFVRGRAALVLHSTDSTFKSDSIWGSMVWGMYANPNWNCSTKKRKRDWTANRAEQFIQYNIQLRGPGSFSLHIKSESRTTVPTCSHRRRRRRSSATIRARLSRLHVTTFSSAAYCFAAKRPPYGSLKIKKYAISAAIRGEAKC
jgi:hypothetical protein